MISTLHIPARIDFLTPFQAWLRELSALAGLSPEEGSALQLGAEEIFVNIVKYAFPDRKDPVFQIDFDMETTGLSLCFRVKGMPFDPAAVPAYDPELLALEGKFQGVGMYLAGRMVDRMVFRNNGREGYSIELAKFSAVSRVHCHPDPRPAAAPDRAQSPVAPDGDYVIRPLHPEEALEICRCAYETYGYAYEEYVYYPEKIVEMNDSGCMSSLVAVTETGEVMGHIAAKRKTPQDPIAELGVFFVRPEYRSRKIGGRLTAEMIRVAADSGLRGLFVRAVAGHERSQKMAAASGFVDCGIMLGLIPPGVEFKGITGVIPQRQSALIQWLRLSTPRPRTLFVTDRYLPFIGPLYGRFGLPFALGDNSFTPDPDTAISVTRTAILNVADIEVHKAGVDLVDQLRHQLRLLCLEQLPAVYLHLGLEQPYTRHCLPDIEALGFFFAGILPESLDGRDAIILQYLNNLCIDYDQIHLHSPESVELLASIRNLDPLQQELGRGGGAQ